MESIKVDIYDFEAKETNNTTSFPLQNFHEHQIEHMKKVVAHNGISFVILRFAKTEEVFLLPSFRFIHLLGSNAKWWAKIYKKRGN